MPVPVNVNTADQRVLAALVQSIRRRPNTAAAGDHTRTQAPRPYFAKQRAVEIAQRIALLRGDADVEVEGMLPSAEPTPFTGWEDFEKRVFRPRPEFAKQANWSKRRVAELRRLGERSPERFWAQMAKQHVSWFAPWKKVLDWKPPFAKWFVGAKTNVSYNCLDRHLEGENAWRRNKAAIVWEGEPGDSRTLTYGELLVASAFPTVVLTLRNLAIAVLFVWAVVRVARTPTHVRLKPRAAASAPDLAADGR